MGNVTIDFAAKTVGKWKETYQWIPVFGAFAAIMTAVLAGANNLPAPFSTPVGSGALTLVKAFITALVIYVPGAAFTGDIATIDGLFTDYFETHQPDSGFLMWSLVIVLVTAAIWLALATYLELPVSAKQSVQSALLGTILVTEGFTYIPFWNKKHVHDFKGGGLVWMMLDWTVAPLVACLCAFLFFAVLKSSVLRHENAERRVLFFLPIGYGSCAGLLCHFVVHQIIPDKISISRLETGVAVAAASLVGALLSLVVVVPLATKRLGKEENHNRENANMSPKHDQSVVISTDRGQSPNVAKSDGNLDFENALREYVQMRVLETVYEEDEKSCPNSPDPPEDSRPADDQSLGAKSSTDQSAQFKQLLQFTPNRLVQARNIQNIKRSTATENASQFIKDFAVSTIFPAIEYDKHTLIRHALAEKYDEIEDCLGFPQLLASCIFALLQCANEIAPILSPYQAIKQIFSNRQTYFDKGQYPGWINETEWWFRAIGGFGASVGLFLFGWRLTQCLGGKLTYVSNSRGLASQLSTITAMIVASMLKFPVSSVHAFVGSLVGVGIADDPKNVNWKLLLKFICGWFVTFVFCSGFAFVSLSASLHHPAYVVP